jgi:hypothetical protein
MVFLLEDNDPDANGSYILYGRFVRRTLRALAIRTKQKKSRTGTAETGVEAKLDGPNLARTTRWVCEFSFFFLSSQDLD